MKPTRQERTAHVRHFLTDVVSDRDLNALEAFVTEDLDAHDLVFGDGGRSKAGSVHTMGQAVLGMATDVAVTVDDLVADGDVVAVRATVRGDQERSLLTPAAPEGPFEVPCVWFFRFEGDRIAELWSLPDGLGLVQQVGVLDAGPGHSQSNDGPKPLNL